MKPQNKTGGSRIAARVMGGWGAAVAGVWCGILLCTPSAVLAGRRIPLSGQIRGATDVERWIGVFSIHTAVTGGDKVWGDEILPVTPDAQGNFTVVLGSTELNIEPADESPDLDQVKFADVEVFVGVQLIPIRNDIQGVPIGFERRPLTPGLVAVSAREADAVVQGGIEASMIEAGAIRSEHVDELAVGGEHILDGSISDQHIGRTGIANIAAEAISDRHLKEAIGSGRIADDAVMSKHIIERSVPRAQLAGLVELSCIHEIALAACSGDTTTGLCNAFASCPLEYDVVGGNCYPGSNIRSAYPDINGWRCESKRVSASLSLSYAIAVCCKTQVVSK